MVVKYRLRTLDSRMNLFQRKSMTELGQIEDIKYDDAEYKLNTRISHLVSCSRVQSISETSCEITIILGSISQLNLHRTFEDVHSDTSGVCA